MQGVREYAVGPALTLIHPGRQYQLRRRHLKNIQDGSSSEQRGLSWYDLRTSYLLDSALSGAISGGFLYTWKRPCFHNAYTWVCLLFLGGRPGVVPGLATGALMCTMLQWCVNELNILRIEYVAGKVAIPVPVANYTSETESPHKAAYSLQPSLQPETKSWHDRFFSLFGRRVSDEEYLKRLKAERDSHLLRIEQLEKELHDRPAS